MLSRAPSKESAAHYDPHAMTLCLQYVNWQDLILMMAVFAAAAFAMVMMAATISTIFTTTATTLTAHHVDQALNLCIGRIAKSDYTALEMQVFA